VVVPPAHAVALISGILLSVVPVVLLSIGFLDRPWPAGPLWLLPATAVVVAAIAFLATERLGASEPEPARRSVW
jgi:putative ABC transport system permease protein